MHNARQRAILSALGIRQWVPRAVATKSASAPTVQLWRHANDEYELAPNNAEVVVANSLLNEAASHSNQFENPADTNATSRVSQAPANLDHHSEAVQAAVLQSELMAKSNADQVDQLTENNAIEDISHFEAESAATMNLHSFRLQACEINQWIVLVNEADLQNPQLSTLWKNILLAFRQPELSHFSWPLSEGQRWQRMTGSKAALNGFLFRLGLDKRVGLMSELADEVCPDRIERLPHLSELIEVPLKKRLLWQLLKEK